MNILGTSRQQGTFSQFDAPASSPNNGLYGIFDSLDHLLGDTGGNRPSGCPVPHATEGWQD
eukprot:6456076-Amphidinium_carterae.2